MSALFHIFTCAFCLSVISLIVLLKVSNCLQTRAVRVHNPLSALRGFTGTELDSQINQIQLHNRFVIGSQ